MANMFPDKLPREVIDDPSRSSEVQVYNALMDQLDDKYHVFYSSPWLGTNSDGSEIDGEADFLVAHADKGILSIEVKGGRIEIDSNNNWTSTDRNNFKRNIKNPVNQARSSKHNLLKKLKESTYWRPRFICARHGVILPHVARPVRDFRPDMPLRLFAFDCDMKHLDAWVESRFHCIEGDETGRIQPLGSDGLYALNDMLARPVRLRVCLGTTVDQDIHDIKLKTDDQVFILREMEANKRMAIAGAAGTGKTILAIEKAIMLAESGKRSLLLCYNNPLSARLQQAVAQYPLIKAINFHKLCFELAQQAKADVTAMSPEQMAANFVDHFVQAGFDEYDAVIIDEGQDFKSDWLTSLEVVVKGGEDGVLYIFYDDNQNVMSTSSACYINRLPLAKHQLTRNFRNTRAIFTRAECYYKGGFVRPIGPKGNVPHFSPFNNDAELKMLLTERIGQLIRTESLDPFDIAILCPDNQFIDKLINAKTTRIGRYPTTCLRSRQPGKVVVDTIRRFKGLESPVVLLILDRETSTNDELLYTGITRAQVVLEIFAPKYVINTLRKD